MSATGLIWLAVLAAIITFLLASLLLHLSILTAAVAESGVYALGLGWIVWHERGRA